MRVQLHEMRHMIAGPIVYPLNDAESVLCSYAPAIVEAAHSVGLPSFGNQNGRMMEGDGGASIADLNVQDGRRRSILRAYTFPYMDRPNLTVLTQALVTRGTIEGKKASGVETLHEGKLSRIRAGEPFLCRAWDSRRLASPPFQKQQNTAEVLT